MYIPTRDCPTSVLRRETQQRGLHAVTRRQMIQTLQGAGVHVLEYTPQFGEVAAPPVSPQQPQQQPEQPEQPEAPVERDYAPISPYIPITPLRGRQLLTDASFSVLHAEIVNAVHSLHVSEMDVIHEIQDIRELKKTLVNDYLTLKNDLTHLKDTLERTLNRDLYVYQIANDIQWNLESHVHVNRYDLENPSFHGKVEDSVIHANVRFDLVRNSQEGVFAERFTVDLPAAMDTTMTLCPIMVLVYSNYDPSTGVYRSESTTCHAYIHRDDPSVLQVFCPLLLDGYDRIQLNITLRYFARLDDRMVTPPRMSSMWYSETQTERNHLAKHQWSVIGDRVELFTHVELVTQMESVDTVRVRLPEEAAQFDVVGYGIIHYTIDGEGLIYSANTPMVRISRNDTQTLVIQSAILMNVHTNVYDNNIDTMHVSTHIVYSKKSDTQVVYDFVVQQPFARMGDVVDVSFRTNTPINSYYITGIRAVSPDQEWPVEGPVEGLQTTWTFTWKVPDNIESDVEVRFIVNLYESTYTTSNSLIVPSEPLRVENVQIEIDHVGTHDVAVWVLGIDTMFEVPYEIRAGTQHVYSGFTRSTSKIWYQWTNLEAETAYTLELLFADPLGNETVYPVSVVTKPVFTSPY